MRYPAIAKVNGYDSNQYTYYPVLIVGAGESGLALGCRLKEKLGFDQFRIFDRQSGLGGTWWINRYPGVACDIPAIFYSYSFAPNPKWTSFHPPGPEIVKYLERVCEQYEIVDKVQLNTDVTKASWLEDEEVWEVTLTHMKPGCGDWSNEDRQDYASKHGEDSIYLKTEVVRAKILASAVGGLVEPSPWPKNVPGRDTFKGDIFHSARWKDDVDLTGKDVVVIGTGCSAAQLVPKLTQAPYCANSVMQVMRSPPWVVPRIQPPFGNENYERWSPIVLSKVPGLAYLLRAMIFSISEYDFRLFGGGDHSARARAKIEESLLRHMKKTVPEKYHEILTPDYGVGCKRRILDATWFPGLNDPKIALSTQPITSIQPHGVTLGPGRLFPPMSKTTSAAPTEQRQIPADVIILANGFEVNEWLHRLPIRGRGGKLMTDVWRERGGAQAYLGTAIDGFPNAFIIFGPNTATGHSSVILATENMVNYALNFMEPILSGEVSQCEVKREAAVSYTKDIQEKLKETVWMSGGCSSWYKTDDGWNSTVYPYSQVWFTFYCMFPKWSDWNIKYTPTGLRKQRFRQYLRAILMIITFLTAVRAWKAGYGVRDGPRLIQDLLVSTIPRILRGGAQASERLTARWS